MVENGRNNLLVLYALFDSRPTGVSVATINHWLASHRPERFDETFSPSPQNEDIENFILSVLTKAELGLY